MNKTFFVIQHLVAASGHVITAVHAQDSEDALRKYKEKYPNRYHLGIHVEEMTDEVQEVFRYDNPNYEG